MKIFHSRLPAFSNLKVLCFTQRCNTKETYSTEQQKHTSRVFFSTVRAKNRIYVSDYPASERTKFVCAVNIYASGTVPVNHFLYTVTSPVNLEQLCHVIRGQ